jgi:hypothetical protein
MNQSILRIVITKLAGFIALFIFTFTRIPGQELLMDSGMESSAGWTVYHMGSTDTARYQFNYTVDGPTGGSEGCLRVTTEKATNILFWQKLNLQGGKSYQTDGFVKTGYVASFWCEVYMSTIAPVENADYSPNNNEDRVWIISTWDGCGPDLDGKFSEVSCGGNGIYIPPGEYGEDVEVYFGIKTGIWNDMEEIEVLMDKFSLNLIENWFLLSTSEGVLDQENLKITDVSPIMTVADFKSGLRASLTASVEVIGMVSGVAIADQNTTLISDTMKVQVTGNQITNYQLETRGIGTGNDIIHALTGMVYPEDSLVTGLPDNARVIQLKSAIAVSSYASYKVTYSNGEMPPNHTLITGDLIITVTAENGNEKIYSIEVNGAPMTPEMLADSSGTFSYLKNRLLNLEGNISWHITREQNPLEGSLLNLLSDNIWIFFDSIRPVEFSKKYLVHIMVGDSIASVDENLRLVQYLNGSAIISHSSAFKPLEIYTEDSLKGSSLELGLYTYYRSNELGEFEDAVKSFRLRRGYMATLARDEQGTGFSRVYIADNGDVIINSLPDGLYNQVSFIRVFPWRWTHKKGWTSNINSADTLYCSWHYDWGAGGTSSLNVEFIPMRHNKYWDAYSKINTKINTTHVLGFNEPEREDQADMTVDEAIEQWPELMRSGLRIGSPAPSDGGRSWLYSFIDRCDKLNYRVDFVALHWYQGGQTAGQFYDYLKSVYDRTGRPVWITEWNNGANWTCCKPTYEEQAVAIEQFTHMLDTTSFVERYSLYEWVEDTRQMFYSTDPVILNPAGIVYRDNMSAMAFNPDVQFGLEYLPIPNPATNPMPHNGAVSIGIDTVLSWSGGEGALFRNIYFGITNPPPYRLNRTDTFYIPGTLECNTTYYWRIDEVNDAGRYPGTVWRFTTRNPTSLETPGPEGNTPAVYPNPAGEYITVHINGHQRPAVIELLDYTGAVILHKELQDNQVISVSHLKCGLYIYKLTYHGMVNTGKIVIQ